MTKFVAGSLPTQRSKSADKQYNNKETLPTTTAASVERHVKKLDSIPCSRKQQATKTKIMQLQNTLERH